MSDGENTLEYRVAWRADDAACERDAELFWLEMKNLPSGADAEKRAKELCILVYDAGRLIAVSTAGLRHIGFLGARLAMFRCTIARDYRGHNLSYDLMTRARQVLEAWSLAHPEDEVMGMATIAQTKDAFLGDGPGVFKGSGLTFIGWTANGERMRVAWFEQARIPRSPPEGARKP
ncbi:MAG TPA: hypothetical protein VLV55_13555 [Rhizomicrobium sp.]|nr:hypothetical protein [Rhizomicrobium sp.]